MGQSTDAYAAFGFDLGDGEEIVWPPSLLDPDGAEEYPYPDLESYIKRRAGLVQPKGDAPQPEWNTYFAELKIAETAFAIDLVSHCSGDYPMYIVALRRTVQRATRGSPTELTTVHTSVEEVAAMKACCDELGLEWQEPKWLLFSNWD